MSLNTVTLTWDLTDLLQAGIRATLSLTPNAVLTDTTNHVVIPEVQRSAQFSNGTGSLAGIVACDNGTILPSGWAYTLTVSVLGQGQLLTEVVQINFANGATQDLSTLIPLSPAPSLLAYLPLPAGTAQAGYVPVATGAGEASAWASPGAASLPLTTLGDILYENATPTPARLPGNTTATKKFLTQTGTGTVSAAPAWGTIAAADVPTLNQNTTGTAANVTGTVAIANGGTGQTGQQAALDALAGAVTSGLVLRGNGTHVTLAAIQAADVPTLNQNTSGSSASCTGNAATATNLAGGATLPAYLAPKAVTLTFAGGGTTTVDASLGNAFNLTLTASTTTLGNPSNPVDGEVIRFRITQGGAGSFTLAYGTAYDFGAAGAPTLTTAAGKVDILGFEYVSSISKWCYVGSGLGF